MQQQLTQGTTLHGGTYRIEQVLGQGSFGITYLATHTALDKQVAIKEFFMKELNGRTEDGSITGMSDGSLSMDYARKFQKEALNLARLEHPNIVRVTDSFADNGTFYYVMDYIEGENLNDYIKHNDISQQEAIEIIRDVAKALMYMHEEKQMLHLDLKPGNIMRRASDGHIFLIDFGLSKHYDNYGQPETSTTIGFGTPGYAPIEQANQAKNGEFRPTIDVYALGATFYKLLTGENPPVASDLVSDDDNFWLKVLKQHNIDDKICQVVVNTMQPSAKKRLQSVRDFIGMVEKDFVSTAKGSKTRKDTLVFIISFIVVLAIGLLLFRTTSFMKVDKVKHKIESPTKGKKEETEKKDPATVKSKDNDNDKASTLRRAISSSDYATVQTLANQGYSAAYGPLAKYYLINHEYSKAETYAKKAQAAGYSEGKSVLKTLENLGYYD